MERYLTAETTQVNTLKAQKEKLSAELATLSSLCQSQTDEVGILA
jgi:hypothetical protein